MLLPRYRGSRPNPLLILSAASILYLALLVSLFLCIPADGLAGLYTAEGLEVHHLLINQDAGIEVGDVIVHAGDRSVESWARRWLREWPPTPNPWRPGMTVPFTVRRGGETLTVDVTLGRLPPGALARRVFSQMQVFTGIAFLVVGILVLWKRPRDQAAQLWFAVTQCLMIIMTSTALVDLQVSLFVHRWIYWVRRADVIFLWLTFSFGLHFLLIFPERKRFLHRFPLTLPLLHLLNPVVSITGSFLLAHSVLDGLLWFRGLYLMVASIFALLGGASLFHSYRTARQITARKQLNTIVWGTIVGLLPYVVSFAVPMALFKRPLLPPNISALVMVLIPASFAFSIARYRLFEIDAILNRSLVYFLLSTLLLGLYGLLFLGLDVLQPAPPWSRPLASAALALAAAALFEPLRARLQRWVDRLFYGGWYDYRTVVRETSRELSRVFDLQQLSDGLLAIADTLRFQAATLLWPEGADLAPRGSFGYGAEELESLRLPMGGALARHLTAVARPRWRRRMGSELATEKLTEAEKTLVTEELVHLWLPLVSRGTLRSVLVMGVRQEPLDAQDLDILATLAGQAAVAAENVVLIETLRAQLAEVEQARDELAEAQRRLGESREAERLRLAREVHDGPIQDLHGVRLRLSAISHERSRDLGAQRLATVQAELLQVIDELRATCQELRPPALAPFGLEAAIRSHAGRFQETHPELEVQVDLMHDGQALPERVRLALFRIHQETLNNVAQHAGASCVVSRFYLNDERVLLEISDDGCGFQVPERWIVLARQGHLGLLGAAERAGSIGGQLEVESAPGKGTVVRVVVPRWETGPDQ